MIGVVCRSLFAAIVLSFGSGCALMAGGLAGAAGYALYEGAESRVYKQPVRVSAAAASIAMHRMGIKPEKQQIDEFGGYLTAETAAGETVKVRVEPEGLGSMVTVRIGAFGDETKSNVFFSKLEEALPQRASESPADIQNAAQIVPEQPDGVIVLPGESTFEANAPIPGRKED
jgi:hypothetical protein